MVRLRLHRQIEVTKAEEYLHLTIGAKVRTELQDTLPTQSFKLHYVELGTSSFKSTGGCDGELIQWLIVSLVVNMSFPQGILTFPLNG
jgi:hypothetical protein